MVIQHILNYLQTESKNEELQDVIQQYINKVFQNTQAPECMCVIWLFILIKKKVAPHLFFSSSWTLFCLFVGCLCFRDPEGEFPQKKKNLISPVASSQNHAYFPHTSISHRRGGRKGEEGLCK